MLPLSLGISLAIISVIGLLMNGYILLVVILTKQISANNILLLHLGFVDSLLCFTFLIFSLPSFAKSDDWLATSEMSCSLHGFLLTLLHPVALWTVCGLNCDRFYAIAAPLHYGALVNTKKVIVGLSCGWFAALLLCIPPFLKVAPYRFNSYVAGCIPDFEFNGTLWYGILYIAITFLVPSILIIGCNIKVLMIARYHRHRIASAIYEVTLSAQVTITHQRNPFFVPMVTAPSAGGPKFRSRSPIASVLQLVGSFLILYSPYYVVVLWKTITSQIYNGIIPENFKTNNILLIIASSILTCSSLVNGLLYGLKSKIMRKTFQNYWRKQMSKNEMINEIQARTPSTCGSRRPSLTPLGFFSRPMLQRRLSETLIDTSANHNRPQMKRIASEISWRPISLSFFGLESPANISRPRDTIPHTSSCNTLQVPRNDNEIVSIADEELYLSLKDSFRSNLKTLNPRINTGNSIICNNNISNNTSSYHQQPIKSNKTAANNLLHKVLRIDHHELNRSSRLTLDTNNLQTRSPRILITRAFSEESDKIPSLPGSPAKERLHRQYSSSSTLLERKFKIVKYKEEEELEKELSDSENELCKIQSSSCSNSTTMSEASCRRYSSLDEKQSNFGRDSETEQNTEEQLLLSWPTTIKKIPKQRQKPINFNNNKLFRESLLFSDRSEEPEVIL